MQDNSTKKEKWRYSDDFHLDEALFLLPHLWWSAAMYGRSLSLAYSKLGRSGGETISGVALTFYRHFLGSLLGMSYELALKALLVSLDDPHGRRIGFPRTHCVRRLWRLVPPEVQTEIECDTLKRGVDGSLAKWFKKHKDFLSAEDRYPEREAKGRGKWTTTVRLLVPRQMSGDLIGQMEVIFDCIMQAMKRTYYSDEQAVLPKEKLEWVRSVMNKFEGLQGTRNQWSHLWGQPVVRPAEDTPPDSRTFTRGTVVGHALDMTLLEQGQEAPPTVVPRLWWIPAGLEGLREFTDADEFNAFVRQQVEGETQ